MKFVLRLNLGGHPPKFWDAEGREVELALSPGETEIHPGVWEKGTVCVNRIGVWKKGLAEPVWGMSHLEPERAWQMYLSRMNIEETFCDVKGRGDEPADEPAAGEHGREEGIGLWHGAVDR